MRILRRMSASPSLLDRAEQILYGRLMRAFPGHVILAQVALARWLVAAPPGGAAAWVADFMILRAEFTPVAVLDLFPGALATAVLAPAAGTERRERNLRLIEAGVKILPIDATDLPGEAALKALVAAAPLRDAPLRGFQRVG